MTKIKLFATTWSTDTAGVSPHGNMRTELFFKGCGRAMDGNPCKGCFNSPLWFNTDEDKAYTAQEIAAQIVKHAPYPYVTIGGGEPTDQMEGLVELTGLLKQAGFHIMVYSWKDLEDMLSDKTGERQGFINLLNNIDMLVDGEFKMEQRLYRPKAADGFFSSIGSANQTIWDVRTLHRDGTTISGYRMGDVNGMKLDRNNDLVYKLTEQKPPRKLSVIKESVA